MNSLIYFPDTLHTWTRQWPIPSVNNFSGKYSQHWLIPVLKRIPETHFISKSLPKLQITRERNQCIRWSSIYRQMWIKKNACFITFETVPTWLCEAGQHLHASYYRVLFLQVCNYTALNFSLNWFDWLQVKAIIKYYKVQFFAVRRVYSKKEDWKGSSNWTRNLSAIRRLC